MSEEEKKQEQAPKEEATPEVAAVPEEKPVEEKKEIPKPEKPESCQHCNKRLRQKAWYYRNVRWFCNKNCWKEFDKKQKEEAQKAKEGAA